MNSMSKRGRKGADQAAAQEAKNPKKSESVEQVHVGNVERFAEEVGLKSGPELLVYIRKVRGKEILRTLEKERKTQP